MPKKRSSSLSARPRLAAATERMRNSMRGRIPSCPSLPHRVQRRSLRDFEFGRTLGEGSYSTVVAATERETGREYAIKILNKRSIVKDRKVKYVKIEKRALIRLRHPGVVRLHATFHDNTSLYFVLELAKKGELLTYIKKFGSFDISCTTFYAAQLVTVIEYMHSKGVLHRDIKPENILLDERMHIKLTDFGTAKLIDETSDEDEDEQEDPLQLHVTELNEKDDSPPLMGKPLVKIPRFLFHSVPNLKGATTLAHHLKQYQDHHRTKSFVGTAEYVSPELLNQQPACKASDYWALGCILYQMLTGRAPFKAANQYLIFQKISRLEYEFPPSFPDTAKDLVQKLLVIDPKQRLGSPEKGGPAKLKAHPFFESIDWKSLFSDHAPPLQPFAARAAEEAAEEAERKRKKQLDKANRGVGGDEGVPESLTNFDESMVAPGDIANGEEKEGGMSREKAEKLKAQQATSRWQPFMLKNELIMRAGPVVCKRLLFLPFLGKRRQLILTDYPRLLYIDEEHMAQEGEVLWSTRISPELKGRKWFVVKTPSQYLRFEDPQGEASKWVDAIEEVLCRHFS
ncbi:uncharacterized protein VTP21DRAFT_3411 [Calcarisporiella thermophila]|uniref:uncharacterized protein n=1 Tax=Calcarisporiella thermophila TaxID=911321 RepID=UPI00374234DA